jgi:hypothetical protein
MMNGEGERIKEKANQYQAEPKAEELKTVPRKQLFRPIDYSYRPTHLITRLFHFKTTKPTPKKHPFWRPFLPFRLIFLFFYLSVYQPDNTYVFNKLC